MHIDNINVKVYYLRKQRVLMGAKQARGKKRCKFIIYLHKVALCNFRISFKYKKRSLDSGLKTRGIYVRKLILSTYSTSPMNLQGIILGNVIFLKACIIYILFVAHSRNSRVAEMENRSVVDKGWRQERRSRGETVSKTTEAPAPMVMDCSEP